MAVTLIAAVMVMASYFLVLYAGVAFIQDKRFFSSVPKENLAVIPDRKERFRGAHIIGWIIAGIAVLLFVAAAVLSVWDGIKRGFGFKEFFARFLAVLYITAIYDIVFFDWVLLCNSDFFPRYYPEVRGIVGPHQFGYNKKTHIMRFIIYIPICAAAAWLCSSF